MSKVCKQLRPTSSRSTFLILFATILVLVPGFAAAGTMTFVNLSSGHVNYVEEGLRVTSTGAMYLYQGGGGQAMYPSTSTLTMTLSLEAGSPFTLESMDIAERVFALPQTVVFVGTLSGGGTVTATVTTDGPSGYQTVYFPANFTNLTSVSWDETDPVAECLYDNIVASVSGSVPVELRTWGSLKALFLR